MGDKCLKTVNREYEPMNLSFDELFKNKFKTTLNDLELYGTIRTAQELFEGQFNEKLGMNSYWVNYNNKFALFIANEVRIEDNKINRIFVGQNSELYAVSMDNKNIYKLKLKEHSCKYVGQFKDRE